MFAFDGSEMTCAFGPLPLAIQLLSRDLIWQRREREKKENKRYVVVGRKWKDTEISYENRYFQYLWKFAAFREKALNVLSKTAIEVM